LYAFVPGNQAIKKVIGMALDTNSLRDFQVGFLDAEGSLIQRLSVTSETLMGATGRAEQIADELSAADFFITAGPNAPPGARAAAPLGIAKLLTPLGRLIFSHVGHH
jgi:hypothetical protein